MSRAVRIDASPYARRWLEMHPGSWDQIEAECLLANVSGVTLLARSPGGPYSARISGGAYAGDKASPIAALRAAIDEARWKEEGFR